MILKDFLISHPSLDYNSYIYIPYHRSKIGKYHDLGNNLISVQKYLENKSEINKYFENMLQLGDNKIDMNTLNVYF